MSQCNESGHVIVLLHLGLYFQYRTMRRCDVRSITMELHLVVRRTSLSDELDVKVMTFSTSVIACRSDVDEVFHAFVMVNK